jgi:2-polyprenyl-6-methoxyphenol hydroxylase-like FAD-dependent oxidoreductase
MEIAIVGGGIGGLTLALALHQRGIGARVYERAPEIKALGVGITLLPHAVRELTALGLQERLLADGIENQESCFFNRFGQLIYKEPRGKRAGLPVPEIGMHRGNLQVILYETARARLGADRLFTDHRAVSVEQDASGATIHFEETSTGRRLDPVRADAVIAYDGVNSTIRKQLYPDDAVVFTGINTWRGVTRHKPILTGRSYLRIGSILTGKIVIYPIVDNIDGDGNQLINWTTEIKRDTTEMNDWNTPGRLEDFIDVYASWVFDWLDVPALIRASDILFEYPMVDKNPLPKWSFGRLTLAGDAAHPMYPRGSNGGAQAVRDARALADCLAASPGDPVAALAAYEAERLVPTSRVVETNRSNPPDFINIKVEELVGDKPFDNLDDYITQDELRALSQQYASVAGFSGADLARR